MSSSPHEHLPLFTTQEGCEFLLLTLINDFTFLDIHFIVANQPVKLFATAKTHKFNNIEDINVDELKFRPIIDQTGTFTCNCSKVTAEYLE